MVKKNASVAHQALLVVLMSLELAGCQGALVSDLVRPASPTGSQGSSTASMPVGSGADNSSDRPTVASYVAKVKNLAVGLPATADEVGAVTKDPNALGSLVDGWMASPLFAQKMRQFYGTAFQQTEVDSTALGTLGVAPVDTYFGPTITRDVHDSFGLTVQELVREGRPFTEVLTTNRYMMTPQLMALYTYIDNRADFVSANPNLSLYFTSQSIPVSQSIDPNSPNFMHWTAPSVSSLVWTSSLCKTDPVVMSVGTLGVDPYTMARVFLQILGGRIPTNYSPKPNIYCDTPPQGWVSPFFQASDDNNWRMVTVRRPGPGESTTKFYDLDALRNATEMVVNAPRVGFFDTYAFQAMWQTNVSNQYRAAMNQSLIVALGQSFDGADQTQPQSLAALDGVHSQPSTACYGCHLTMDPMRQFFRQDWDYSGAGQKNSSLQAMQGQFAWDGVAQSGNGLAALAVNFAASPRFATSWTQKVCTYLRSGPCSPDDPEFLRIAKVFVDSQYNFSTLLRELLTSPLITYAAITKTEQDQGQVYAVNKQVHLCALLSARLRIADVCGLQLGTALPATLQLVPMVASVMSNDGYSRGATAPTQANDPTLSLVSGMENVCKALATNAVDGAQSSLYSSTDPNAAIQDLVHNLMGIDASRDQVPIQILTTHFNSALAGGVSASVALRSTFVVACMSPTTLSNGL